MHVLVRTIWRAFADVSRSREDAVVPPRVIYGLGFCRCDQVVPKRGFIHFSISAL